MPKEKSVPKRLSGSEALDSLMAEIYKRLSNHGHFHSHKAYQGYLAKIQIEFRPAMSFAPPLTDDFEIDSLDPDVAPDGLPLKEVIDIPMRPPNQVREEAGMDLPVQVEEGPILVEKWVKRRAVPRNVVKGGDTSPRQTMVPTTIVASKEELAAR